MDKVRNISGHDELKKEVSSHVDYVKKLFELDKESNLRAIEQQNKNAEGQMKFFNFIRNEVPFTELRTTPLVTRQGFITQKGVDAKIANDLILLAQSNAFDVAILLSGDADLKESIRLIRERYGKLVIIAAYRSPNQDENRDNTISEDLLKECDHFLNFYDFNNEDIEKISVSKENRNPKEV